MSEWDRRVKARNLAQDLQSIADANPVILYNFKTILERKKAKEQPRSSIVSTFYSFIFVLTTVCQGKSKCPALAKNLQTDSPDSPEQSSTLPAPTAPSSCEARARKDIEQTHVCKKHLRCYIPPQSPSVHLALCHGDIAAWAREIVSVFFVCIVQLLTFNQVYRAKYIGNTI